MAAELIGRVVANVDSYLMFEVQICEQEIRKVVGACDVACSEKTESHDIDSNISLSISSHWKNFEGRRSYDQADT